ncbi:MAG: aspartate--tRNA(Asn) ligase [Thermoleophilaceae bacterium]
MATVAAAAASSTAAPERTFVRDLPKQIGQRVVVHGWLAGLRRARTLRFLTVRDRSGAVQAVYRDAENPALLDAMTPESAVRVIGTVGEPANARFGSTEIEVESIELVAAARAPLPLDGGAEPESRLDHRHLDLRPRDRFLVFEVQTTLELAIREYVLARGFVEIHSPKISGGGSESGATVFEVPYFGQSACLVQSPQFYMQMAMAAGFDRAFEIGPVFRNEPGATPRHATEFTIAHFELSWIESHEDLMDLEEDLLRYALSVVQDVHGADIERHCGIAVEVPPEGIPRIPLSEAPGLTGQELGEGGRLLGRAEQALCKYAKEQEGHSFVFLTNYPAADRPFYTMREGELESRSFDLLWRGIELTSGGQREHRHELLRAQTIDAGMDAVTLRRYLEPYFLEMFRYGCPPHGGFGIGVNRLLMALLAQQSIRETSFVFRGPGRFVP